MNNDEEFITVKSAPETGVKRLVKSLGNAAAKAADLAKEAVSNTKKSIVNAIDDNGSGSIEVSDLVAKAKNVASDTKDAVYSALDENGNGEIDIEDVITKGLKIPGVRIDRAVFLQKALAESCSREAVEYAVAFNPARAGISRETIDRAAAEVIGFERKRAAGVSTALSVPGGVASVATIPADIAQYYGYLLRAAQELLYLYGFPEICTPERVRSLNADMLSVFIVCFGVMYGVTGAGTAIKTIAQAFSGGAAGSPLIGEPARAVISPVVKRVSRWFGAHITKEVLAQCFESAIPVVGGVLGGGITYLTFKPCCDKLKAALQSTPLSAPASITAD